MKKISTIFLQTAVVLIGIGALAFLLWEPHLEGVNAQATSLRQIYFDDPFLWYAYIASIPFFVALYQAFVALSRPTVKALRTIRYCAIATIGFVAGGEAIILSIGTDDRPPAIVMGAFIVLGSIVVAAVARKFERIIENKLTA